MFVHVIVEGTRFMIVMSVAGGVYDYLSFLISQDKTYSWEEEAVSKVQNPAGEDQDEVVDTLADNIFEYCFRVVRNIWMIVVEVPLINIISKV